MKLIITDIKDFRLPIEGAHKIISQCYYGSTSPFVKTVQDRAISYIHPDFVIRKGEMQRSRQKFKIQQNRKGIFRFMCYSIYAAKNNKKG